MVLRHSTKALIDPHQLLPAGSDGLEINPEMIDLAISLSPSRATKETFAHLAPIGSAALASFNQTTHVAVAVTPIGVSIETKVAGEGLAAAHTQLATWLLA